MIQYRVEVTYSKGASIRPAPSTNNMAVGFYPATSIFYASALVADKDDPTNANKSWAVIDSDPVNMYKFAGMFVAVKYPSSSGPVDRADEEPMTDPPPPTGETVTVHVELDDNGTIYSGDATLAKQ
jgi:hypothetical protein